ncbi:1-acyl-sn-glycerol-3-phosphate acyltransferase [Pseudoclavibacter alba]|uniref:1-acyl-sn-glycerol-3-phosphate acyltransferase n=1 Tax=Pseudoclavibacter albus TaxID=272241 RepID=A0ABT2HXG1_9MICO|nr:lysophospholipid acyltransferase family protein [Pseudoclavibacter alba]MBN6778766.1 1-acyl-sn-glycerol-3-phosphate acyltransferase [Pseudoclavibacter alba]MCT2042989.1 1-acyl-sn-glycerol-3-phosphate acyltransferase [Pseudoclavibacter alba]
MLYLLLKHLFAGPLLKSTFRPWVTGVEHIPAKGPVILASNHLSVIDSVFLPLVIDRRVTFLAKKEYFTGKGIKGWLTRQFFLATGMLPIDRGGGAASEASLRTGLQVLSEGKALGIYPEGTRSPDARLYRGRTGIARMIMAMDAKVPVVPVAMIDTEKVMPIGTTIPRVRRIGIVIGEPIDFSRYSGMHADRFLMRAITDEVMSELHALSNQEFCDIYASSVRNKMNTVSRLSA